MTDERETRSESSYELERRGDGGGRVRPMVDSSLGFVAEHALPLTMIGLGVGWLVAGLRKQSAHTPHVDEPSDPYLVEQASLGYGYRGASVSSRMVVGVQEGIGELAQRAGDVGSEARLRASELSHRAGELASSARARAGELASELSDRTHQLSHEARERLAHAQRRGVEYADDNPFLVGALAIGAGIGVGLLLPSTRKEDSLLGEVRDRLLDDTRGLLGEARQAARETGRELQRQVGETKRELGNAVRDTRTAH